MGISYVAASIGFARSLRRRPDRPRPALPKSELAPYILERRIHDSARPPLSSRNRLSEIGKRSSLPFTPPATYVPAAIAQHSRGPVDTAGPLDRGAQQRSAFRPGSLQLVVIAERACHRVAGRTQVSLYVRCRCERSVWRTPRSTPPRKKPAAAIATSTCESAKSSCVLVGAVRLRFAQFRRHLELPNGPPG